MYCLKKCYDALMLPQWAVSFMMMMARGHHIISENYGRSEGDRERSARSRLQEA